MVGPIRNTLKRLPRSGETPTVPVTNADSSTTFSGVSITRRILESTQSGLSKLTSLVIADDEPLSNVESAALQAELSARRAARDRSKRKAGDHPVAKIATSAPDAAVHRKRQAADRNTKIKRERAQREAQQRQAADEAFRRMKQQAAAGGTWTPPPSSNNARPPRPGSNEAQLLEWYKVLDLPLGADLAAVKSSYRKLMRKYHPDMHAGNPQKQKAANELSMRVTAAYNGLSAHLEKPT
jgi:DnaJ-domain-containing protein 1